MKHLDLKILPDVVLLITAAVMCGAARLTPPLAGLPLLTRVIAGGIPFLLGLAIVQAAGLEFRRASTSTDPLRPGSASALVTSGIYRFSRNPMYLGMAVVLLGWGLFLMNFISLALVSFFVTYITLFQILPEERLLAARFGDVYRSYGKKVRRWI
ncbi:MAG: isoprenylcysteine carboxylmethyltransferase family protein [Anaerolineaceae bacterium]